MRPKGDAFFNVAGVVGDGFDADGFEHDHGGAALNDAEEDVAGFGTLEGDLEAELIAIEGERGGDIPGDEAGAMQVSCGVVVVRGF
jgi:hypothetical protein